MSDTDPFFETLEPPPGGLTRLRARLRQPDTHRPRLGWVVGGLALAAVVLAALSIDRSPPDAFEAALFAHLDAPVASVPAAARQTTALTVVSTSPSVVFVRIARVPAEQGVQGRP